MTIKELKALIADMPDNTLIVADDRDHSYRRARIGKRTALVSARDRHYMYEDYGDENKDFPNDKRIDVLHVE